MKPWLTYTEAAYLAKRSKRTIRRWAADGRLNTIHDSNGDPLVAAADVMTVEAETTKYRRNPTRPEPKKRSIPM